MFIANAIRLFWPSSFRSDMLFRLLKELRGMVGARVNKHSAPNGAWSGFELVISERLCGLWLSLEFKLSVAPGNQNLKVEL